MNGGRFGSAFFDLMEKFAMNKDFFEEKASSYDNDKNRVTNVKNISSAIIAKIPFHKNMDVLDFGSGTGLLLESVAPYVKKITALDVSKSMNKQLEEKREYLDCELEILEMDLEVSELTRQFDVIMSSMTLHHIRDIASIFGKFYTMLESGGLIAIADLDSEDGSFHTEDTGVFHNGFDRHAITAVAKASGFHDVEISDASLVSKPHGEYSVFLLTAKK